MTDFEHQDPPQHIKDQCYREVDGYLVYGGGSGFLAAHHLRQIANYLDRENEEWDREVQRIFDQGDDLGWYADEGDGFSQG